jgi:hypothetical protein
MRRRSSGRIVSDYALDDRAIEIRSPTVADFSSSPCVQTGSGAHPASYPMGTGGPFPGGKARPGRDADHSPPSSAEVKNEKELYLLFPHVPPWRVAGQLHFTYIYTHTYIHTYVRTHTHTHTHIHTYIHTHTHTDRHTHTHTHTYHYPLSSFKLENALIFPSTPPYVFVAFCLSTETALPLTELSRNPGESS